MNPTQMDLRWSEAVQNTSPLWQSRIVEWLKLMQRQCSVITELPVSSPWSLAVNHSQSLITAWRCTQRPTRTKDRQYRDEDRHIVYLPLHFNSTVMIIHVQPLYNSLEETKCWSKAFIIKDLREHYCFCCLKQTLQAIIIIIICPETRSTQIGSVSVIKRCTPCLFGKGDGVNFMVLLKGTLCRMLMLNLWGIIWPLLSKRGRCIWMLSPFGMVNYVKMKKQMEISATNLNVSRAGRTKTIQIRSLCNDTLKCFSFPLSLFPFYFQV